MYPEASASGPEPEGSGYMFIGVVMICCSPDMMKMGDDPYLRTAVFAEFFDEHGCSSVQVFSKEKFDMLKLQRYIVVCLVLLCGIADYASGQSNTQTTLEDIQRQIFSLRAEFKHHIQKAEQEREAIYNNIQQKLAVMAESGQVLDAEFTARLKQLLVSLDQYDSKLTLLEQSLDTLEAGINTDLDAIEAQLVMVKKQGLPKPATTSGEPETPPEEPTILDTFAPGQLFRAAYRIYMDGEYDVAIAGFQKYLQEYPKTELAGAAQYWIAESLMKLNEYEIAIQEYDWLITTYPNDVKVSDAYYGKGFALLKLQRPAEARAVFRYVLTTFPKTIAAQKAQRRIDEM